MPTTVGGGAGLRVTVMEEGAVVIDRILAGMEDRIAAPLQNPGVISGVLAAFHIITAKAFSTEGASTGAPWRQLARSTQAERKRMGFPAAHPILQRTQRLMRSLVYGEGARVATRPTSLSYVVGPEVGYFRFHQSRRPRKVLPRRAPVLLTADDRTKLLHPIRLYITGHL
jgi:hypothetical protein